MYQAASVYHLICGVEVDQTAMTESKAAEVETMDERKCVGMQFTLWSADRCVWYGSAIMSPTCTSNHDGGRPVE
jgi:hypothetical protein